MFNKGVRTRIYATGGVIPRKGGFLLDFRSVCFADFSVCWMSLSEATWDSLLLGQTAAIHPTSNAMMFVHTRSFPTRVHLPSSDVQFECFSAVHVSTMPFIFRFFLVAVRLAIPRLVLGPMQQMSSRWKALDALESMGQAASAAAMIIGIISTGS